MDVGQLCISYLLEVQVFLCQNVSCDGEMCLIVILVGEFSVLINIIKLDLEFVVVSGSLIIVFFGIMVSGIFIVEVCNNGVILEVG